MDRRDFLKISSISALAVTSNAQIYDSETQFPSENNFAKEKATETNHPVMCEKMKMQADGIVRLSKIEVYPEYIEEYMKYAVEVGEISLLTEPGVLTMYAVSEKDNPCNVTILETYASKSAYEQHIASEHFQKYKKGTLHMVKNLVLSDQSPLNPKNRIVNFIQE